MNHLFLKYTFKVEKTDQTTKAPVSLSLSLFFFYLEKGVEVSNSYISRHLDITDVDVLMNPTTIRFLKLQLVLKVLPDE